MKIRNAIFEIFLLLNVIACIPTPASVDPETGLDVSHDDQSLIIGTLDWSETTALAAGSAERINSLAVGYLSIPARSARCTAFLIAPDIIMTNQHCMPSAASAVGASVSFAREAGVPQSQWATYSCTSLIGNDATLDFALVRCSGNPGASHGTLTLDAQVPSAGSALYAIHQNCDFFTTPSCSPNKKYSPGSLLRTNGNALYHDCDMLGGSSGAPVFSGQNHQVVAIHNLGFNPQSNGRGDYNGGVRMAPIIRDSAAFSHDSVGRRYAESHAVTGAAERGCA